MLQEFTLVAAKPLLVNAAMALLASLVRFFLLPREEREARDILTFLVFALFVSQVATWIVSPLALEPDTKYAAAAVAALLANEIIRGVLQVSIKLFPVLEKRIAEYIGKVKL